MSYTSNLAEEWKTKGNHELQNGNPTTAIEYFTNGIKCQPNNAILYSNRSAAYASLNDWNNALEDAEKAILHKPEWIKGYSRKGLALYKLNRYESSINAYKKAIEIDNTNEELKKSLSIVENALKASELNVLGEEKLNKGKASQAIPFFDDALQKDANNALYYCNRAHANNLCGRYDAAINDADEVIRRRPQWHRGYQRKAESLFGKKLYNEAASVYAYTLQIQPDNETLTKAFNSARQEAFLHQKREEMKNNAPKNKKR